LRPAALAIFAVGLAAAACGEGGGSSDPTTIPPAPSTEAPATTNTSDPCFKFPVLVLRLQNDFREASRGIIAPDRAEYRARAQALVDEARSLGCPMPVGLTSFLR